MKLAFVELGRVALDLARRLPAQEHHFVGYGPNSEPVAFFSDWDGLESPHHDLSEALPQNGTRLDAAGWLDVWMASAV